MQINTNQKAVILAAVICFALLMICNKPAFSDSLSTMDFIEYLQTSVDSSHVHGFDLSTMALGISFGNIDPSGRNLIKLYDEFEFALEAYKYFYECYIFCDSCISCKRGLEISISKIVLALALAEDELEGLDRLDLKEKIKLMSSVIFMQDVYSTIASSNPSITPRLAKEKIDIVLDFLSPLIDKKTLGNGDKNTGTGNDR